ncbi:MAG: holo-ACP synthase [Lachnospiraceae bacterium]|nr:holo-ACP synthase [Lachnospiraceae bacterium]MBP3610768.1 holo-ACP synthase [Lachnospiraceae bacterium]
MIYGIGTDLIEVERIRRAYEKESFRKKIYTEQEQQLIAEHAQKAAGNFAVKESVAKAFGTGFGKISPIDIEVLRESSGRPYVVLHGPAEKLARAEGILHVHVSISNLKEYAMAYVVMEA